MSRPAKLIVLLIGLATLGGVLADYFAYRNSTDGQGGGFLWLLVLYGLFGTGVVWAVDAAARRFRR